MYKEKWKTSNEFMSIICYHEINTKSYYGSNLKQITIYHGAP